MSLHETEVCYCRVGLGARPPIDSRFVSIYSTEIGRSNINNASFVAKRTTCKDTRSIVNIKDLEL